MKHTFVFRLFVLSVVLCIAAGEAGANNLRQFSSKHGLSNSAILSICQDKDGLLWIGSCDGLNVYDGSELRRYKPADIQNNLSGNLIDNIMEAEENVLWISTNYGLDRFDTHRQTVQRFKEFQDINLMAKTTENDLFVIKDDGYIYYFNPKHQQFYKLDAERLIFEKVQYVCVDSSHILWIFSSDGDVRSYAVEKSADEVRLVPKQLFQPEGKLFWTSGEEDQVYFIDSTYALYEYDLCNRKKYFIADLEKEILQRGQVSAIVKQRYDYYISFKSNGLICLKYLADQKIKYTIQSIGIQSGIFCLMKDRFQDIIWVGTDGQGVYMYYADHFSVRNTLLDNPVYQVNNPVRALFLDGEQTLWVGTKGSGILRMMNYQPDKEKNTNVEKLLTANSALTDNSVYCFAPSRWKRLWIGTETGLNYYSYPERKIKEFTVFADDKIVKYVHSICEPNDSTLWIATVGEGIVKVSLDTSGSTPQVKSARRLVLNGGKKSSNYFFVSYQESDSIIWYGNRGYGAYRMNIRTTRMQPYRFDKAIKNQTVNDIFAIHKNDEGYWFGTSFGLTRLHQGDYRVYNETDGFPNNTIHGILQGKDSNLWLSTNQGMVKFNVRDNTVQIYRQQGELEVTEFSDGAYFKDERTGSLFFGGTNGFITISENEYAVRDYMPDLRFNRLSIFGKDCNIHDFLQGDDEQMLVLDDSRNFFNLSFSVVDYINGNNYTYSYKIDGLSDNWVENGLSTTAVFSNLSPGEYTLLVKYRSNITGKESTPFPLRISITPPWYMTRWAYVLYFLLFMTFMAGCIWMIIIRYRRKRNRMIEKMNRQQREELYESKLRFFTNITHEFCTPLTLINGPCEKILSYNKVDGYVRKYASMIQQNALKLNALILELIEFRRLETGNKMLKVKSAYITEQIQTIAESFDELAERRKLDYRFRIEGELYWNTDVSCLSKIVNNLISNAFKYTPEYGMITVEARIEDKQLCIRISNTGKGIKEADLSKIFDRYKILDNFEVQNKNGISPRNGLGLAICQSMVNLLEGQIQVESSPNELTVFEVLLPWLEAADNSEEEDKVIETPVLSADEQAVVLKNTSVEFDKNKQTLMIIDDAPSMLWFVAEVFVGKYNVVALDSAEEALNQLTQQLPDLIISDVMMPGMDGMSFARKVKSDKMLGRVPLILLSALNDIDEQTRGIESGAEAYITKPFNVEYLENVVKRLLQREMELKEYYSSVLSSFELNEGHLLHKEDRTFFEHMIQIINENIENPDLSVELLSNLLGYSTRQFYRKLKTVTEKTPTDIIKEYRLAVVERLLLTTQLSIDEIMYKTGFANRGTFYKVFAQKFEMTPKQYRTLKQEDVQGAKEEKE